MIKKAHRRWALIIGLMVQRPLNSRVHRPLNTLSRRLPCGLRALGHVRGEQAKNIGVRVRISNILTFSVLFPRWHPKGPPQEKH